MGLPYRKCCACKATLVEGRPRAECILKSIYIILCAIGLELWMTGYRLPGLEEISVADWLDNSMSRQRLALWLSILVSAYAVHLIVYQVPISAMTTLGQTLTVLALCILPTASCELAYLDWQNLHKQGSWASSRDAT